MNVIHLGIIFMIIIQAFLVEGSPVLVQKNVKHHPKCFTGARNNVHIINRQAKKDLFVSRGWGASGMPFSVLYMKSPYTPQLRSEIMDRPQALQQFQENSKYKSPSRKNKNGKNNKKGNTVDKGSVLPQLFVSYSWGPLGRK